MWIAFSLLLRRLSFNRALPTILIKALDRTQPPQPPGFKIVLGKGRAPGVGKLLKTRACDVSLPEKPSAPPYAVRALLICSVAIFRLAVGEPPWLDYV